MSREDIQSHRSKLALALLVSSQDGTAPHRALIIYLSANLNDRVDFNAAFLAKVNDLNSRITLREKTRKNIYHLITVFHRLIDCEALHTFAISCQHGVLDRWWAIYSSLGELDAKIERTKTTNTYSMVVNWLTQTMQYQGNSYFSHGFKTRITACIILGAIFPNRSEEEKTEIIKLLINTASSSGSLNETITVRYAACEALREIYNAQGITDKNKTDFIDALQKVISACKSARDQDVNEKKTELLNELDHMLRELILKEEIVDEAFITKQLDGLMSSEGEINYAPLRTLSVIIKAGKIPEGQLATTFNKLLDINPRYLVTDPDVREIFSKMLSSIVKELAKDDKAIPSHQLLDQLIACCPASKSTLNRIAALNALSTIVGKIPSDKLAKVMTELMSAINDENWNVCEAGYNLLREMAKANKIPKNQITKSFEFLRYAVQPSRYNVPVEAKQAAYDALCALVNTSHFTIETLNEGDDWLGRALVQTGDSVNYNALGIIAKKIPEEDRVRVADKLIEGRNNENQHRREEAFRAMGAMAAVMPADRCDRIINILSFCAGNKKESSQTRNTACNALGLMLTEREKPTITEINKVFTALVEQIQNTDNDESIRKAAYTALVSVIAKKADACSVDPTVLKSLVNTAAELFRFSQFADNSVLKTLVGCVTEHPALKAALKKHSKLPAHFLALLNLDDASLSPAAPTSEIPQLAVWRANAKLESARVQLNLCMRRGGAVDDTADDISADQTAVLRFTASAEGEGIKAIGAFIKELYGMGSTTTRAAGLFGASAASATSTSRPTQSETEATKAFFEFLASPEGSKVREYFSKELSNELINTETDSKRLESLVQTAVRLMVQSQETASSVAEGANPRRTGTINDDDDSNNSFSSSDSFRRQ